MAWDSKREELKKTNPNAFLKDRKQLALRACDRAAYAWRLWRPDELTDLPELEDPEQLDGLATSLQEPGQPDSLASSLEDPEQPDSLASSLEDPEQPLSIASSLEDGLPPVPECNESKSNDN